MTRILNRWGRLFLLGALFALLLNAATQLSATVDEGFHITSGYEYVRTGKLRLFDEHPPLVKALFAWPLLFVPDLTPPEVAADHESGDLIAVAQATTLAYRPLDRVIVAPRIVAALLTVLFAATLYRCASSFGGPKAGLLALLFCTFDPNFLAHGSLATTDMGTTAFIFWALWAGTRWLQQPTRRRWWIAALLLGLTQGAKLTALLVYPVLGLGTLFNAGLLRRGGEKRVRPLKAFAGMVGASLLVLWALYGFELRPVANILGGNVPLPAASHIERWIRLQENLAYGRESFLLGQNSMHGWLLYFPVAFLVKTPLSILILLFAALLWQIYRLSHLKFHVSRFTFYLFPLLYALASLGSSLNIGYRHLLPVLPFLYMGVTSCRLQVAGYKIKSRFTFYLSHLTQYVLLTWLIFGTLATAPHHIAFFNEIAGGAKNGWRFLADSNTDWGQTFKALAAYQEAHDLGTVQLSAFTFYDPAAYGVDYTPIAPMTGAPPVLPQRFNPEVGTYALSATTLDGVPLPYPSTFDWFRHREPFEKIGHVMFVYNVDPLAGQWLAQCNTPVVPLSQEAIVEGFGIDELRQITFDCEQSWVLPSGGQSPGWYARAIPEQTRLRWPTQNPRRADLLPEWIAELPLANLRLSYMQPRHSTLPAFALWERAACSLPTLQTPVDLAGTLAYRGLKAPPHAHAGETINIITFWEVLIPPDKPLSLMLHLRGDDGTPIAVGDGLGFPVEQWQKGDVFIQNHKLSLPANIVEGEYRLYSGAYWLEDDPVLLSDRTIYSAKMKIRNE